MISSFFLFIGIVLVPGLFTLGKGLDLTWGGIHLHHHTAGRLLGFFFLAQALLFVLSPSFRKELLEAANDYDQRPASTHRRIELSLLAGLGLWLGFLKVWQARHLLTACWDHGIYLNVMWHIAHGDGFQSSFRHMNFLGDHFNLILAPLAIPFRWFAWPSWPLLAQTVAMLGAIGLVLELARREHPLAPFERLLVAVFFTLNLYFQTVHAFDMHPIAFAPLAAVTAYLLGRRKRWVAYYCFLPIALFGIQEDVPLILLGLSLTWLADRRTRRHGLVTAALSVAAFWLMVHQWIPAVGGPTVYTSRYQTMGGTIDRIAVTLLSRPWIPLKMLFVDGHLWPLLKILGSFGFLPLTAGPLAWALLPPVLQQSLCDYDGQYGYGYHYSSNVLGFLMIGTVAALSRRRIRREWLLPGAALLMAWFGFRAPVYMVPRDSQLIEATWELARATPLETAVSVQNTLGVPFALRPRVCRFPDVGEATLIVLSRKDKPLPLSQAEFAAAVAALEQDPRWVRFEDRGLLLFRRR